MKDGIHEEEVDLDDVVFEFDQKLEVELDLDLELENGFHHPSAFVKG